MNVLITEKGYNANYLIKKAESIGVKLLFHQDQWEIIQEFTIKIYINIEILSRECFYIIWNNLEGPSQDMISLMQVIVMSSVKFFNTSVKTLH